MFADVQWRIEISRAFWKRRENISYVPTWVMGRQVSDQQKEEEVDGRWRNIKQLGIKLFCLLNEDTVKKFWIFYVAS